MTTTKRIASMKFIKSSKFEYGDFIETIGIYSYWKQIGWMEFRNNKIDYYSLDLNFYSMTTRKHQGIAKAICEDVFYNDRSENYTSVLIKFSKSLKDLISRFGYKSVRNTYGIDGNRK